MSYSTYISSFQFLVDYKLYGMSYLHLGVVKFRHIGQENPDSLTRYCRWRMNSMEPNVSSVLRYVAYFVTHLMLYDDFDYCVQQCTLHIVCLPQLLHGACIISKYVHTYVYLFIHISYYFSVCA